MLAQSIKMSFLKTLCSFKKLCGGDNREARLRKKVASKVEDALDIRKVVSFGRNLKVLLSVLLSREQLILFRLSDKHTLKERTPSERESSSSEGDLSFTETT